MILVFPRIVSNNFTRPADTTAYTIGDLVANNTTAGSVIPLRFNIGKGGFLVTSSNLTKSSNVITLADFKLHLFNTSPTVANGDNGANSYSFSSKIGIVDYATMTAATDVGFANLTGLNIMSYSANGVIYGLLEADAAYTPTSAEVFTVSLVVEKRG